MKTKHLLILTCFVPLSLAANSPEPTSALEYQQTTNTRIVVEENYLRFFTGGAERMTIDEDGNVGIGTLEPEATLDVNGGAIIRGSLAVFGNDLTLGRGGYRDLGDVTNQRALVHWHGDQLYVNYDGDFEGGVRVQGVKTVIDGNLGIGTTDPESYKLNVNGNIRATSYLDIGLKRPSDGRPEGLFINAEDGDSYSSIQLATRAWSGSHAILFNAYKSGVQANGGLSYTGNTKYTNNAGNYSSGAGSIMYFGNGGIMCFYISQASTGTGTDVNWGTAKMQIRRNGTVGINTNSPDENYMLHVNGKTFATSFHTAANSYADFVFEDEYRLAPLSEVEQFIEANHHLPDIPSEAEAKKNGVDLQEMQAKLLQKIEELTLYVIEQNKKIETQSEQLLNHQKEIGELKAKQ